MSANDNPLFGRALLVRIPQLLLAVVAITLMVRTDRFFTPGTLSSILTLASIVGVLAVGQTFALIGGGFDLSQGAILAFSAACAAWLAKLGYHPLIVGFVALSVGLLLGTINGSFVAIVRTNPFVTTLSAMLIYRGAAFVLLHGNPISGVRSFEFLNQGITISGTLVPYRGFVFLAVAFIAWLVLRQTVFGQYVYAVGGNIEAARLSGVRTTRIKVGSFALSGLAAGLAAILLLSWIRIAKPDTGANYELDSIAACVVGGVSLQGGSGSVLGAAAGCLLLQSLATLITMSGFPDEYRTLVTGAVILTFAAADALARRSERA
jgi:ribose/xylose/arabinose/galactoside ABC-type transport system permease subunit